LNCGEGPDKGSFFFLCEEALSIRIYTSYFAKLKTLPSDILPISICAKTPFWYDGVQYPKLAPSWSILCEYKLGRDEDAYCFRFHREVLGKLNAELVLEELRNLSGSKDAVLVCYEKPADFCHRHLVAAWLYNKTGVSVDEL
jgi:hypothetical protein